MKHILRIFTVTMLCSGASLHSEIKTIRAVKDLTVHPLTRVGVTLEQTNGTQNSVIFTKNSDGKPELYYDTNLGDVMISVEMNRKPNKRVPDSSTYHPKDLENKEIHIVKSKRDGFDYDVELKPARKKKSSAPKKQKIRAEKTTDTDLNSDWTVLIVDQKGGHISKSIFKKDAEGFAKSLYVRLNQPAIRDKNDLNAKYNVNVVQVVKGKNKQSGILTSKPITKFDDGDEIRINNESVYIVSVDGKEKLIAPNNP